MAIENTRPPRSVQQPRVVDVSRPGQALAVEIDAAEAAELLLSIATLLAEEDRDTYELEAARIDELLAAVPPDLLRETSELLPEKTASQLLGLVYTTPKPRTASAFLDHLAATDPVEIRLHLLGYYGGHHLAEPETLRRAAEGDAGAVGEVLDAYSSTSIPKSARRRRQCSAQTPPRASARSSKSSQAGTSTSCRSSCRPTRRSPSETRRRSASS